jgi:hypothetical protein
MKVILSIYHRKDKINVINIDQNGEPEELFKNWIFSTDNANQENSIHEFVGFYYTEEKKKSNRKSGMMYFKKEFLGNISFIHKEQFLYYEVYCPCCDESYFVEEDKVKLNKSGEYYCIDSDDQVRFVTPFNPMESCYLGVNKFKSILKEMYNRHNSAA